jgi:hypothetical protein
MQAALARPRCGWGGACPGRLIRSRRKPWPANCRSSRSVRSENIGQLSEKFPKTFKTTEFIPGILRAVTTRRARGPRRPPAAAGEDMQTLPVWKAFVVQFSRETNPRARTFSGRVEHMSSGRRARFASSRELVAVLGKLLCELGEQ